MPPPDESRAKRNGSVPSTRAISASASRRSTEGGAIWPASESAAGSSRERSRDRGLLMEMGSYQMLHDGRNEGGRRQSAALFATGGQPILKMDCAKPRMFAGRERPVVQLCSEIAGVDIGDDLARVLGRGQVFPAEFVEAQSFRAGEFDHAVDGIGKRDVGEGGCDVVRGHWLKQGGRQPGNLSVRGGIDDAADELEK